MCFLSYPYLIYWSDTYLEQIGNGLKAYTYQWQKLIAVTILCAFAFAVRITFIEKLIWKQPLKHSCPVSIEEFEKRVALKWTQ